MSILSAKKTLTGKQQLNGGPDPEAEFKKRELQLQVTQDVKNMKKKDFYEKYKNLSADELKSTGAILYTPKAGDKEALDDLYEHFRYVSDEEYNDLARARDKAKNEIEQYGKSASEAANYIKNYSGPYKQALAIKQAAQQKYNYDIEGKSPEITPDIARQEIYRGMVEEGQNRIKTKTDVKVPGDEKEKATCISGTCTLAANQGVDFSKMTGRKDEKGRNIPINNALFYQELDKSPYEIIPYEKRMPGDFVQYEENRDGKLVPAHMEMYLSKNKYVPTADVLWNNYSLTNYKDDIDPGISNRAFIKDPKTGNLVAESQGGAFENARVLRLKDADALAAYAKTHPEYASTIENYRKGKQQFESSQEGKDYSAIQQQLKNKNAAVLGKDAGLFDEIISGISGQYANDPTGLKKSIEKKAQNSYLVNKVIDNIYAAGK